MGNCFTREVWSTAKKAFCCKTRHMGCPHKQNSKKPLKANSICYAFYESNPAGGVNRKNDCPKGYKCASNSNMMSFNTVMRCVKASVSGGSSTTIPQDCTSWYDGCNTCSSGAERFLGAPGGLASEKAKPTAGNTLKNNNSMLTMLLTWRTKVLCTIKTAAMSSKRDGLFEYITRSPLYFIFLFLFSCLRH